MVKLSSLLPREDKFFDLLEASADEVKSSSTLLSLMLTGLNGNHPQDAIDQFIQHRRKDKEITKQITELLCRTFVTPIDREDIIALSVSLYKISKNIERIGERLITYELKPWKKDFDQQNDLITRASDILVFMVRSLRELKTPDDTRAKNQELQRLEGEGDKLVLGLTRKLFLESSDVKELLLRKEMYEMLEKTLDRFRDAGNIMVEIILKHT